MFAQLDTPATYWAPSGFNEFGVRTFTAPTIRYGAWQDVQEIVRGPTGEDLLCKTAFFTDEPLQPTGYLFLGEVLQADNPLTVEGSQEIKQVKRIPDIRSLRTLYKGVL